MTRALTPSHAELAAERPEGQHEDVHCPLSVVRALVSAWSDPGAWVLDPFAGFGTTLVAAAELGRRSLGVELLEDRARLAKRRVGKAGHVVVGDARRLSRLLRLQVDLCVTSPPYMTARDHPQNPPNGYRTVDGDYPTYLDEVEEVFRQVALVVRPGGHVLINVADTGPRGSTPLVADVAERVSQNLRLVQRLPVLWDEPPAGISNDPVLVYRRD